MIDLAYEGSSLTELSAKNIMDIKYTLSSENDSVVRDLEIDDDGNIFIESANDDIVTFTTDYDNTLVDGLYWGSAYVYDGSKANTESDWLYTANEKVVITSGVSMTSLNVSRLDQLSYGLYIEPQVTGILKEIRLDDITVSNPDLVIDGDTVKSVDYGIDEYMLNYKSFVEGKSVTLEVDILESDGLKTYTSDINKQLIYDGITVDVIHIK